MRRLIAPALAVAAALAVMTAAVPRVAAEASDAARAMVGEWEISNADHDKTCTVSFKVDGAAGGFALDFDKTTCGIGFPPLKDVVSWTLSDDDVVRLLDSKGKVAFEFTEVESGMYESLRPGQPLTFLQSAAVTAASVARTADQMTGEWNVIRGSGDPICTLNLSNTPVGADLALKVNPGCDPDVTGFGPATWQMDKGELVLKSAKGQTWRFEEADGMWQRIPEGDDPLLLTRE